MIEKYPEAQASMCIYFKLTAVTEIGISEIQLNKDYHSSPFLSLPDSPVPFLQGF